MLFRSETKPLGGGNGIETYNTVERGRQKRILQETIQHIHTNNAREMIEENLTKENQTKARIPAHTPLDKRVSSRVPGQKERRP